MGTQFQHGLSTLAYQKAVLCGCGVHRAGRTTTSTDDLTPLPHQVRRNHDNGGNDNQPWNTAQHQAYRNGNSRDDVQGKDISPQPGSFAGVAVEVRKAPVKIQKDIEFFCRCKAGQRRILERRNRNTIDDAHHRSAALNSKVVS
jgi:hypothetical protein